MRAEDCSGDVKSADTAKIHLMASTRLQKIKELKMNEEIYANSGITTDNTSTHSDDSNNYEDIYANEDVPETGVTRSRKGTVTSGTHTHTHTHTHKGLSQMVSCDPRSNQEFADENLQANSRRNTKQSLRQLKMNLKISKRE